MKKIILSTSLLFLLNSTLIANENSLPKEFYNLPIEQQKELLKNEQKLNEFIFDLSNKIDKKQIEIELAKIEKIEKEKQLKLEEEKLNAIEIQKKLQTKELSTNKNVSINMDVKNNPSFNVSTIKKEELISKKYIDERYKGKLEFVILDSKNNLSKVNIGNNNGYKINTKNKIKFNLLNAKLKFPVGEYEIDEINEQLEEGEIKVFQVSMKNALEYVGFATENKMEFISIGYIDGELFFDLSANNEALKIKVNSENIKIEKDTKLICHSGLALNLSNAEIKIRQK